MTAEAGLVRASASIAWWNLVSRVSGFVRVLAVGAALGTTFLGNTYQSANLVSNILFELLAAGVLSSVLVPTFVARLDREERQDATDLAGAVLGVLLVVLTPLALVGILAGPWVMRVLTIAVSDAGVREQEVATGSFFLAFFLPQVLLYAVGTVATGLLHADRRFAAAAAAPVANNLVVIATMALYWVTRTSGAPGLDLPVGDKVLLAAGTTGGVLAMTTLPMVAAWRAGLSLRPRWLPRHPALRGMARQGAWAAGYLALTQLLLTVTLVLANHVEGGVVAYHIAFTFFLLPYALAGQPVLTALYPRLASDAAREAWDAFTTRLRDGLRMVAFVVLPASALLAALAAPAMDVVSIGALASGGPLVARTLAAYAVGVIGYVGFQLLTRASYAAGDTRSPTLVNLGVAAGGSALMLLWSGAVTGGDRVVVLGAAHSVAQIAGAVVLFVLLARRLPSVPVAGGAFGRALLAAAAAGAAAYVLVRVAGAPTSRGAAALVLIAGAGLGSVLYLALQRVFGATELEAWRRSGGVA